MLSEKLSYFCEQIYNNIIGREEKGGDGLLLLI